MKQYLFMCGTPRSGTTYLANLIGAHPSIVLGVERFKFHYSRQTLVPELFEKERFFDLRGSDTSLRLQVALPDSGRMQEKFDGARYVGDKYPNLIKQLGLVLSRFPGATILFVLRDPLSVGLSWGARARNPKDHWPATNDCIAGIRFWMEAVRAAAAARAAGARIIAMDYERLATGDRPGAELHLRATLQAMDLPLPPELLERLFETRRPGASSHNCTEEERAAARAALASPAWDAFASAFSADGMTQPAWASATMPLDVAVDSPGRGNAVDQST